MGAVTTRQIRRIHALKNRLSLSEEEYRNWLSEYGVRSSKELSFEEAERLIEDMEGLAIIEGVWERLDGKRKYEDLGNREGMATPKQLRMIEALWRDVSRARSVKERERTLRSFLRNRFGIEDLRWVESWQVKKIVEALRAMKCSRRR